MKFKPLPHNTLPTRFNLIKHFRRQAAKHGWEQAAIDNRIKQAQARDYRFLRGTLSKHFDIPQS